MRQTTMYNHCDFREWAPNNAQADPNDYTELVALPMRASGGATTSVGAILGVASVCSFAGAASVTSDGPPPPVNTGAAVDDATAGGLSATGGTTGAGAVTRIGMEAEGLAAL